ncbi:CD9 molecule a [Danio rerio]|uniref:Tetraspanin n=1 Tax=Danio rerio TaxID=7955 RepID=Q6NWG7_DANRE|nr:CD9 molecule a [Danio rerio]AAH59691.1 CD9 antigen (p24) [Danio rerio]AAH67597.1 CD9 antigen (p24) [Danio rerio]|eukprot:NP_997784.1 CD9 antigen [Danio rerio]
MGVEGCPKCIKYSMFLLNSVFWIAGTAVLAVGLWLRFDPKTKSLFEGENSPYVFYTGVYILIAAGALMMVVGFFGCCGAIQESPCMLGLFFFFLLVIFAVEVAAGIWGFSNQTKVTEDITTFYRQTYDTYQQSKQEALKKTLRLFQHGLNCCGPSGNMQESLDETCPKKEGLDNLIIKSCPDAIDEVFNSKLHIIGGVGIATGVIMIFGMIFSMMLCCAIRKTREIV